LTQENGIRPTPRKWYKKDIINVGILKQNTCSDRAKVKLYICAKIYFRIVPNSEEIKGKPPVLDGYWYRTSNE
jgi:hypothetical protein